MLFDCEFARYSIDRGVRLLARQTGVDMATVLGSICERARIRSVMKAQDVEIVRKAAAYEHVSVPGETKSTE